MLIFIATPLSIVVSLVGVFLDRQKVAAVVALVIGGAMGALIGFSFLMAFLC